MATAMMSFLEHHLESFTHYPYMLSFSTFALLVLPQSIISHNPCILRFRCSNYSREPHHWNLTLAGTTHLCYLSGIGLSFHQSIQTCETASAPYLSPAIKQPQQMLFPSRTYNFAHRNSEGNRFNDRSICTRVSLSNPARVVPKFPRLKNRSFDMGTARFDRPVEYCECEHDTDTR